MTLDTAALLALPLAVGWFSAPSTEHFGFATSSNSQTR